MVVEKTDEKLVWGNAVFAKNGWLFLRGKENLVISGQKIMDVVEKFHSFGEVYFYTENFFDTISNFTNPQFKSIPNVKRYRDELTVLTHKFLTHEISILDYDLAEQEIKDKIEKEKEIHKQGINPEQREHIWGFFKLGKNNDNIMLFFSKESKETDKNRRFYTFTHDIVNVVAGKIPNTDLYLFKNVKDAFIFRLRKIIKKHIKIQEKYEKMLLPLNVKLLKLEELMKKIDNRKYEFERIKKFSNDKILALYNKNKSRYRELLKRNLDRLERGRKNLELLEKKLETIEDKEEKLLMTKEIKKQKRLISKFETDSFRITSNLQILDKPALEWFNEYGRSLVGELKKIPEFERQVTNLKVEKIEIEEKMERCKNIINSCESRINNLL